MLTLAVLPWKAIFVSAIAAVIRNGAGWLENVCDAKSEGGEKITKYELAQLGATTIRVGLLSLAAYFPLNALGIEAAEFAAAGSAIVLDFLLKALKTKKMVIEEPEKTKK